MISDEAIERVIAEVRPAYTETSAAAIECTVRRTVEAIDAGIPGHLVECGTWLGGMSFAMLLAQRYAYGEIRRPVWMCDSFQGMSPPGEMDRDAHGWWNVAATKPNRLDNEYCIAPLANVKEAIKATGLGGHIHLCPGWFQETLSTIRPPGIAVLRVDCDWYDPVKCVLTELMPLVSDGAPVILDDYYAWEGCALAVHEYLSAHKLPYQIRTIGASNDGAWMVKGRVRW